jgi:glycosyltransferase involved in cell wall biosynthesis
MMKNELLIIGPDAEKHGLGGVTVHVSRLRNCLEKHHVDYTFKDYKTTNLRSLINEIKKSHVVHLHVSNPIYQFVLVACSRMMGHNVVMTLHGNYGRFGWLKNMFVKYAVKFASVPIVINNDSYERCLDFNRQTKLIPAFIPPQMKEELQKEIIELMNRLHGEGRIIVSTNASAVAWDKQGREIYGVDFLVRFFKEDYRRVLVVSDPSGNYRKRYASLQSNSVFFIGYPHSYYELLKYVDYFVRNTSTDGDALSVKEALSLGVPTLCTDVVDRPEGVSLFKYCDEHSFETALSSNLIVSTHYNDGVKSLLDIYKSFKISVR